MVVTVVVAEVVPRRWWEHVLHNKTALFIRTAFLFQKNVVVTAVPYLMGNGLEPGGMLRRPPSADGKTEEAA